MKQSIRLRFTALIFLVLTLLMAGLPPSNNFRPERLFRNYEGRDPARAFPGLGFSAAV